MTTLQCDAEAHNMEFCAVLVTKIVKKHGLVRRQPLTAQNLRANVTS